MNRHICLHGHFYQPPRENPWLESVEQQDSAYPYHDWNDRISAECYGPNAAARILDPERRIIDIVNNYERMSFNMGPTLLSWMEKSRPEIYEAILEADRAGCRRFAGHGTAISQAYNHIIMPLASSRDKRTQILWGIKDFEHRFQRFPEGMWLAETAVDLETLDMLAEQGIRFTILAPRQASRIRRPGQEQWQDVSGERIDPRRPYLCRLPSGRSIALFFYDGAISRDVAFNGLLANGEMFANRLLAAFSQDGQSPQLVHIATDGETYGHHHYKGDMALCYCQYWIEANNLACITVYGQYLELHPPQDEVEIFENSSWSCEHGIERWRSNCGCCSDTTSGWQQKWRGPLRGAMDWLRDNLARIFDDRLRPLMRNPWKARDAYIKVVLDRREENVRAFLRRHAGRELSRGESMAALKLFEMQRNAMLMYTSCGWFFDEISGIENVQIMHYAARAMQLAREASGIPLEEAYCSLLENAPSNIPDIGTGAEAYRRYVKPAEIDILRVGAHYAISSLFEDYPETASPYVFTITRHANERLEAGRQKLATGKITVRSRVTWEEELISFAVLHLGDHNIAGGVRPFISKEAFAAMTESVSDAFRRGDMSQSIRAIVENFGTNNYSLWHLFRNEQRAIVNRIFEDTHREIEASFRQIYEHHYPIMQAVDGLNLPLPEYFSVVVEFIVHEDLQALFDNDDLNPEKLNRLAAEAARWNLQLDRPKLALRAARKIAASMEQLSKSLKDAGIIDNIIHLLKATETLKLQPDIWAAQNIYFTISTNALAPMQQRADRGDKQAQHWISRFETLGEHLMVRCR